MNKQNIETIFELSPMQEGMLFHTLFAGQDDPYVYQYAARIAGELDVCAFTSAWQLVTARHQALRASFHWQEVEKPLQIIHKQVELPFAQEDWRELPAQEQTARLEAYLAADREQGFALAKAPLMRLSLLRVGDDLHDFVWSFHHLLLDGWSVPLLLREIFACYEAFHYQRKIEIAPTRPFQDYVAWLRRQTLDEAEGFWRQALKGVTEPTPLPEDLGQSATDEPDIHMGETLTLPANMTAALRALARQYQLTLNTIVQGVWALALSHYSGRSDVLFGAVVSGRPPALDDVEQMIGLFINTLPLRVQFDQDETVSNWLKRLQAEQVAARQYEHSPLAQVQGWSEIGRGRPLFESIIAFENFPIDNTAQWWGGGNGLRIVSSRSFERNNYPLGLIVLPHKELTLGFSYSRRRFAIATVRRLLQDLGAALESINARPQQRLAELRRELWPAASPAKPVEAGWPADVAERMDLTQSQLAFWMAQQLQPELPLFNMASLFIIEREIDPARFRQSFQALVNSSDALRTVFEDVDGAPRQRIHASIDFKPDYLDFSRQPDPEAALRAWADARCRIPFRLTERLFDAALVKLAEGRYAWYLNQHQLVADAWATSLIVRGVSDLYERGSGAETPDTIALPQFQEHAERERAYLRTPRYQKAQAYWAERLAKRLDPIEFYGQTPPPLTTRVVRAHRQIGDERSRQLRALAARKELSAGWTDATLFNIFATILYAYLARMSGARALALGTAVHNRHSTKAKETIGLFMQTLLLQVEIGPDETLLSLLNKVSAAMVEVVRHSGYHVRNTLQHKTYDTFLNYLNTSICDFAGAPVTSRWLHPGAGNETMALQVYDFGQKGALELDFDFDEQVFDASQRDQTIEHFMQVLDSFLTDYTQPISSISLLTPAERQRILVDFNRTEVLVPTDKTYPRLFEAQARRTPEAIAAICGEQLVTYAQLNARANRLARYLKSKGVGPEQVVALLDRRGINLLTAIIAVMKAGGAYLPLDPDDPGKRHAQLLRQSRSVLSLASEEFQPALSAAVAAMQKAERPAILLLNRSLRDRFSDKDLPSYSGPKNLAYVIYTSGSTGRPKGVMIEQEGMINHIYAKLRDTSLTAEDTLAQTATQCFDSSVWQFLGPLLVGGRVHIFSDAEAHDPVALLNLLGAGQVTILSTVPSLLSAMLETVSATTPGRWPLSTLKCLLEMGEALPADLCREWMRRYPHQRMINAYGLTECSDDITHYVVADPPAPDEARVPIGGPLANTRFYVLDDRWQPAPLRVTGELYVGGLAVGRGYIGDVERTAEKFFPDPFGGESGARLYRSGDLARYLPDGNLDYLGRMDQQAKIRGFRIEFGEIEAVLRQHPGVKESVVVALDDSARQKKLVAYVTARSQHEAGAGALREFMREHLPDYMVPAHIVTLDALPLNANGKVDRKALPVQGLSLPVAAGAYVAPRNPLELQLAQLWQDLLGLARVGVTDNFFDLGGHSLLAVRLLAQIRRRTGQELPLATLIEAGTIERMAAALQQPGAQQQSPLVPIQPQGERPPFFCVHPGSGNVLCYLPLAQHIGADQPFYGLLDPNTLVSHDQQSQTDFEAPLPLMAANYIEALKRVQPRGPYFLGGWSFGGFVAYEMAQQLRRAGEEVALLAILDTGPVFEKLSSADDADLLAILCEESDLTIDVAELKRLAPQAQLNYVAEQLRAAQRMPADIPVSWVGRSINIFKARIRVMLAYKLQPYNGRLTLFRAAEVDKDVTDADDETMGWQRLTTHPVEVHIVPGNHATLGREPHVAVLAAKMRACLARKEEEAASKDSHLSIRGLS